MWENWSGFVGIAECTGSGELDEDVGTLNVHWETGMGEIRVKAVLTAGHIELPAVPRTCDNRPGKRALTERSPSVRTNTIHGKIPIAHVK